MKSIIKITTMLLAGMLLLLAVPAFSQKSTAEKAAKEAADAAKTATDEAAKPADERDCNKIAREVNKAKAAAEKAKAAAENAQDASDKSPKDKSKKEDAKDAKDAADAAKKSLDDAYKAAPGMKTAEDIKKKVDGTTETDNSQGKKIKQELKDAADKAGADNPCDPDAVKRAVEKKLEDIEKRVQKNQELKTWFERNFPEKDGKRLNISFGGNVNDLFAKATGTGNTTGHIATLTLTNSTGQPITAPIGNFYIPSCGQYQPYVVPSIRPITIAPNATVEVPLQGYCADVFTKPVPNGTTMPAFENWTNPNTGNLSDFIPTTGSGWVPAQPGGSGFVPTIPGTDRPIGHTIDPNRYPTEAAPILSSALDAITDAVDRLVQAGEITTPFSGNPEKEREAIIQQTFWIFSSALAGKDYSQEDFKENTIRQYETSTGRSFAKQNEETRQSVEDGVNQFWNTFEAVGVEAKVLKSNPTAPTEKWGDIVEGYYQKYAVARMRGRSHDDAMRDAINSPDLRREWSGPFRKRYGK
ncbi:MAG: hypothetical protein K9J37_06730 [Saprospiraceae bacterium]|nr:hypothetical protein [Saprospiraceae bacterium]MCF8249589.1 hypothetical protein [Saprospiraceae bacterium]MCF8280489.1 hypothetical protein [Bacteroidales bacterium]MCF8310421.1 hypothetical protein [Saprospiraceae bacterium]MCF8439799.1 hypothetical protein [Saprospiraceae bacterium]